MVGWVVGCSVGYGGWLCEWLGGCLPIGWFIGWGLVHWLVNSWLAGWLSSHKCKGYNRKRNAAWGVRCARRWPCLGRCPYLRSDPLAASFSRFVHFCQSTVYLVPHVNADCRDIYVMCSLDFCFVLFYVCHPIMRSMSFNVDHARNIPGESTEENQGKSTIITGH